MSTHVDVIASQLPTMAAEDIAKIRQLTDVLLGKGKTEVVNFDDPTERIMFQALRAELDSLGINSNISHTSFAESRYYKNWKRGVKQVGEFCDKAFRGYVKSETQRLGLYRIFLQTLIKDFKRKDIPVSVGTIANNVHRVPQAFNNAFPGYVESGMAYLIPQAMLRGRKSVS